MYVFVVVADIPYDSHFYAHDDINRAVNFKCITDQHFTEHFSLGFAAEIFFVIFLGVGVGVLQVICKSWNIFCIVEHFFMKKKC